MMYAVPLLLFMIASVWAMYDGYGYADRMIAADLPYEDRWPKYVFMYWAIVIVYVIGLEIGG